MELQRELKFVRRGVRFRAHIGFSLRRIINVKGVNSDLHGQLEGSHFLMWDFDDTPALAVHMALKEVQGRFELPPIHILSTGKYGGYHAYCFKLCHFHEARGIIGFTRCVDKQFLALGIGRGYFTLRFTDVPEREYLPFMVLPSKVAPDLKCTDISSFVEYTKRR